VTRVIRFGLAGRMALTPNWKTLYVCSGFAVVPVSTANGRTGRPVRVSRRAPQWIVISRNGRTGYVTTVHSHKVYPVQLATGRVLTPVDVGGQPANSGGPDRSVVAPAGHIAYFGMKDQVTPVDTSTNTALRPVSISGEPIFIGFAPDGKTAYVTRQYPADVVPIRVATGTALRPITFSHHFIPLELAVTPDGKSAYVSGAVMGGDTVVPINLATGTALRPIKAGISPGPIAITPDGRTMYVGADGSFVTGERAPSTVTPVRIATSKPGRAIKVIGPPEQIVFSP
jgi:DNA-binding beta-propeller fold protein YncE